MLFLAQVWAPQPNKLFGRYSQKHGLDKNGKVGYRRRLHKIHTEAGGTSKTGWYPFFFLL